MRVMRKDSAIVTILCAVAWLCVCAEGRNMTEVTLTPNETSIVIRHPESGEEYKSNEQFTWKLRNEDEEAIGFSVRVVHMDIEKCCDRVIIPRDQCFQDLTLSKTEETYFQFVEPILDITFSSDESTEKTGFTLEVSALYEGEETPCLGDVTLTPENNSIIIRHPPSGEKYKSYEEVYWTVKNEDENAIGFSVRVVQMDVERCCDKVIIPRDQCFNDLILSRTEETYFQFMEPILHITFTSDLQIEETGFTVEVSALYEGEETPCPGEVTLTPEETSVIIQHPSIDDLYLDNEQFTWTIRNVDEQAIGFSVRVVHMDVERCCDNVTIPRDQCFFDLIISDSEETSFQFVEELLNITFISDDSVEETGFTLEVSALYEGEETPCPGEVTLTPEENSTVISHPPSGGQYKNGERLTWIVRKGDQNATGFAVTVVNMDVEQCCDKVIIPRDQFFDEVIISQSEETYFEFEQPVLNITFTSDNHIKGTGFTLKISALY